MAGAYSCVDEILDELLVELAGATVNAVKLACRDALREFLTESAAWRIELEPFTVKANKEIYYLDPPFANSQILYIHGMSRRLGDRWVPMGLGADVDFESTGSTAGATMPLYCRGFADTPGKVAMRPILTADAVRAVRPTVSLIFRDPWDGQIPLFIMRYWREVIKNGTLGRMMQQQDKPYSNPVMGQYHLRRFRSGIARAREMAKRQYTEADHTFTFPRWA